MMSRCHSRSRTGLPTSAPSGTTRYFSQKRIIRSDRSSAPGIQQNVVNCFACIAGALRLQQLLYMSLHSLFELLLFFRRTRFESLSQQLGINAEQILLCPKRRFRKRVHETGLPGSRQLFRPTLHHPTTLNRSAACPPISASPWPSGAFSPAFAACRSMPADTVSRKSRALVA